MVDFEESVNESGADQAPPEPVEQESSESSPEQEQTAGSQPERQSVQAPKEAPFHEHPRFKELIDKNRTSENENRLLRERLEKLEKGFNSQPAAPKPADQFIEKLNGIDPELAKRIARISETGETVQQLVQRLDASEAATKAAQIEGIRTQAQTSLRNLYSENKVSQDAQRFYEAAIKDMANANPTATLEDLPKYFKEVHEQFSKYTDSLRRSDRKSYVVDKKTDAKAPTPQPKGEAAKPAKPKVAMDKEQMLAELAKSAVSKYRAGSNI